MNISDNNIKKLRSLKEKFYDSIKNEIKEKVIEDGTIKVFLDTVEKDYEYFFKSDDNIFIKKQKDDIIITDTLSDKGAFIENANLYNFIICKAKIKEVILKSIESYNKNNDKIKNLID